MRWQWITSPGVLLGREDATAAGYVLTDLASNKCNQSECPRRSHGATTRQPRSQQRAVFLPLRVVCSSLRPPSSLSTLSQQPARVRRLSILHLGAEERAGESGGHSLRRRGRPPPARRTASQHGETLLDTRRSGPLQSEGGLTSRLRNAQRTHRRMPAREESASPSRVAARCCVHGRVEKEFGQLIV
jgi:hypothetical protein